MKLYKNEIKKLNELVNELETISYDVNDNNVRLVFEEEIYEVVKCSNKMYFVRYEYCFRCEGEIEYIEFRNLNDCIEYIKEEKLAI